VELSESEPPKAAPTPPNSIQRVRSVYRDPLPFLAAGKQRALNSAGPGRTNVDFLFLSTSPLAKEFTVQLRAEFCSLVNHPQFDLPGQTNGSPSAAVIYGGGGNAARHSVQLTPPVLIDVPRLAGVPKQLGLQTLEQARHVNARSRRFESGRLKRNRFGKSSRPSGCRLQASRDGCLHRN
jgi:hypothetical protein